MRQLLYISTSTKPAIGDVLATILVQSRRNNAAAGLSGLLWTDGSRFLQVLEGDDQSLSTTFSRIATDARHKAIVMLHDRSIADRTFGLWSMALSTDCDERIATALRDADSVIKSTFEGLIAARRAA